MCSALAHCLCVSLILVSAAHASGHACSTTSLRMSCAPRVSRCSLRCSYMLAPYVLTAHVLYVFACVAPHLEASFIIFLLLHDFVFACASLISCFHVHVCRFSSLLMSFTYACICCPSSRFLICKGAPWFSFAWSCAPHVSRFSFHLCGSHVLTPHVVPLHTFRVFTCVASHMSLVFTSLPLLQESLSHVRTPFFLFFTYSSCVLN